MSYDRHLEALIAHHNQLLHRASWCRQFVRFIPKISRVQVWSRRNVFL